MALKKCITPLLWVTLVCLVVACNEKIKDIEPKIPEASFTFETGKDGQVKFTNNSVNATKFVWKFGGDSTSQSQNPTFTFSRNGSYLVTLVAYNGPLIDSTQQTVNISEVTSKVFICGDRGICTLLNAKTGEKIWDYKTGDNILSSPTFYENKLFISSTVYMQPGKMIALHYTTGKPLWEYKTLGHNVSSPIVQDNKLVFISGSEAGAKSKSTLYCVNATTGKLIWETDFDGYTDSSPTIDKGLIYFVSSRGLEIVDLLTGKTLTTSATARNLRPAQPNGLNMYYSSPVIANGMCYYYQDSKLILYYIVEKHPRSSGISVVSDSSPAFDNGILFINTYDLLYAIDAHTYNPRWAINFQRGGWIDSPLVANNMVYTVRDGELYAIDAAKGTKKWSLEGGFYSSANYNNGIVYVASLNEISAIDAITGAILWKTTSNLDGIGLGRISSPLIITEKGEAIHTSVSGARN